MSRRRKIMFSLLGLCITGFIALQIIPVGNFIAVLKRVDNPPVITDIQWDSAETEHLVRTACYDCHSNETVWPWYSNIAPVSWLIVRDVNKGRRAMNFSEEGADKIDVKDIEWHVTHDMPLWYYLPLHPEANLTDEQKIQLVAGLRAIFGEGGNSGMDMSAG